MTQYATTITFEAGSTTTITNFTMTGESGAPVTINSSVSGTQFTLTKPTGTANVNYLSIQDSNVSSAFFSNLTSTDLGNNNGWNFTAPSVVQGNFSSFF
jgi:hypothetical protein